MDALAGLAQCSGPAGRAAVSEEHFRRLLSDITQTLFDVTRRAGSSPALICSCTPGLARGQAPLLRGRCHAFLWEGASSN